MCNSRYYDIISVSVSILAGIAFTVLAFLNFITSFIIGPWLSIALGAFAIAVLTISATSLLRQDDTMNACICEKGKKLLIPSLALIAVSAFTVLFALTNLLISLILAFIISTLFVYTLFSLYCFLACIVRAGCNSSCGC